MFRRFLNVCFSETVRFRFISFRCEIVAAVVRKAGEPLVIEEITVAPPKSGEVRIRVICSSLCHSDITLRNLEVVYYIYYYYYYYYYLVLLFIEQTLACIYRQNFTISKKLKYIEFELVLV